LAKSKATGARLSSLMGAKHFSRSNTIGWSWWS